MRLQFAQLIPRMLGIAKQFEQGFRVALTNGLADMIEFQLVAKSLARERRKTMQGMKLWEKRFMKRAGLCLKKVAG